MSATESAITIVMNHGLQVYGGDLYVGSMTILQSVLQLVFVPISGFTNGVQPIISYNFGAGKFDRVKMTIKRMISITFLAAFVYVFFAMLRPGLFARLFTTDEDLIALVKKVLPVYIAGMSVFGVQSGVQSSFLGLGQAKISLCIALLRKVILLIPLALILPRFFGVMGVYYAEPRGGYPLRSHRQHPLPAEHPEDSLQGDAGESDPYDMSFRTGSIPLRVISLWLVAT